MPCINQINIFIMNLKIKILVNLVLFIFWSGKLLLAKPTDEFQYLYILAILLHVFLVAYYSNELNKKVKVVEERSDRDKADRREYLKVVYKGYKENYEVRNETPYFGFRYYLYCEALEKLKGFSDPYEVEVWVGQMEKAWYNYKNN